MSQNPCPKPGFCLDLEPRLERVEDASSRHEAMISKCAMTLDSVKSDVHAIRVEGTIRGGQADNLAKWFLSLIAIGLLQFGGTVWWASSLNTTVTTVVAQYADHEARLRLEERESAARHKP